MATKQQEREALDKIAEIIKGLGQDSYIAAAFDGCLDMAEDNIGNDFMCSMKARAEEAQKEVASLLVENRKQADGLQALSEAVAQKQKNIDGRDEQIANLNSITGGGRRELREPCHGPGERKRPPESPPVRHPDEVRR